MELNELKVRAFGSDYVFPNRRTSKMPHITVHNLRRTCRSLLASLGIPGHVAERCLNHKLKGVEGIYNRHDYFNERREALELLAQKLEPII